MGLIRTGECERIDEEMARLFPGHTGAETRKDEYSEDFVVWLTVGEEVHSIRVTIEEYRDGDWVENLRMALRDLKAATE